MLVYVTYRLPVEVELEIEKRVEAVRTLQAMTDSLATSSRLEHR